MGERRRGRAIWKTLEVSGVGMDMRADECLAVLFLLIHELLVIDLIPIRKFK